MNKKDTKSSLIMLTKIVTILGLVTTLFVSATNIANANNRDDATYKTFEIVIPSFNNELWAEATLRSVCFQNYPEDKYHITYINDASTDQTQKIVATFIKQNHLEKRVTLINNTINKGQMENRYRAFHNLPDTTIIAECDGDDFYAHNNVLKELNAIYKTPNAWMLYTTKYRAFPQNSVKTLHTFTQQEIRSNSFRNFKDRRTCQLRSYYAWLFKQVKLKDLLYKGHFYPILTDPAYMIPMLEMAGFHNQCINKILYLRNTTNPLSVLKKYDTDFREKIYQDISSKTPYNRLSEPTIKKPSKHNQTPELIICCTSISSLDTIIAIAQEKITGFNTCQVFLELKNGPQVNYKPSIKIPFKLCCTTYDSNQKTLQKSLQTYLAQSKSSTIAIITKEELSISNRIDLTRCSNILAESFAPIFYLHDVKDFSQDQAPHVQIKNDIWAGQFNYLHPYHTSGMLLCNKEFLQEKLNPSRIKTVAELNQNIATWTIPPDDICLFFKKADKE